MHSSIHRAGHFVLSPAPAAGLLALLCLAAALLQAAIPTLQLALPGFDSALHQLQQLQQLQYPPAPGAGSSGVVASYSPPGGPRAWEGCVALSLETLRNGGWWRLMCYPTVHANLWHWVLAAAGLYSAGRSVESVVGSRHVLLASLMGVLWGGVAHCAAARAGLVSPGQWVLGALPACTALVGMYATLLPGWPPGGSPRSLGAWRPAARDTGWGAALCLAVWWASGWFPEAGPAAMLGALGSGWAYTRLLGFGSSLFYHKLVRERADSDRRIEQMNWDEFVSSELDPILEKIARQGLHSLTRREKAILRQSRRKLEGW